MTKRVMDTVCMLTIKLNKTSNNEGCGKHSLTVISLECIHFAVGVTVHGYYLYRVHELYSAVHILKVVNKLSKLNVAPFLLGYFLLLVMGISYLC